MDRIIIYIIVLDSLLYCELRWTEFFVSLSDFERCYQNLVSSHKNSKHIPFI